MKTTLHNFLFASVVCGAIIFLFSFSLKNRRKELLEKGTKFNREENSNDPEDRAKYYHMLLRDPSTNEIPPNIRQRELQFAKKLEMKNKLMKISSVNTLTWKQAGPNDVGGRTRGLAVDVANPNIIIAGAASGGIWKSTDNGTTWQEKSTTDQLLSVRSIAQDTRPGHTNTWYFSGGEFVANSATDPSGETPLLGNGIYKSTDDGDTWNILPVTQSTDPTTWNSNFDYTTRIIVSPTTGSVFVGANGSGIYRSTDGGNSFNLVLGGINEHIWSDVAATTNGTIIAAISSPFQGITAKNKPGIYKSNDDGTTWTNITPSTFPDTTQRTVLGVTAADPNIVYSLTNTGDLDANKHEIIKLYKINITNGTFSDRSANLPDFSNIQSISNVAKNEGVIHTQGNYNMVIAVKPDDENFVLIGATDLFRSTDGFSTKPDNVKNDWIGGYNPTSFGYPGFHPDIHCYAFVPNNPDKMWWGCDGGLVYTDNITDTSYAQYFPWQDKNQGYDVTQFYEIDIPPAAGDTRIMGGCQDNGTPFFRFDGTTTSSSIDASSGDGAYAFFGPNYAYTESENGVLLRLSYDQSGNISNQSQYSEITPSGAKNQMFVNPYVIDPNNPDIMYYLAGSEIWRNNQLTSIPNNQNGTNVGWTDLTNFSAPQGYIISTIAVSTTPANILYYAEFNYQQPPKIIKVTNASTATSGAVDISIPNAPSGAFIEDIAVNPDNANEIIVVMSNYNIIGLYHSTDGGQTYTAIEGNLQGTKQNPGPSLRSASILPSNSGNSYFVATSIGLFSTNTLNGSTTNWVQEGPNVIGNVVSDYVVSRKSDGEVVVGTHGRGAFEGFASSGTGNAILSVNTNQLNIGVKPNQTGNTSFQIKNSGNAQLNFSVSTTGGPTIASPLGSSQYIRATLKSTPDFNKKFRNKNVRNDFLRYSAGKYKGTDLIKPDAISKVTAEDSIVMDDGNNYADGEYGDYGYDFYWMNVFSVNGTFNLNKIKFIMNTESVSGPAPNNLVEIAVYQINNNAFGNKLFDTTLYMDTASLGAWYEYDFPQYALNNLNFTSGEKFGVIIGALNTALLFPAALDYNGQVTGSSYYYDPIFNDWPLLSSLGGNYSKAVWVVRAYGSNGVTTNQPPVAVANVSPQTANINTDITFDGSGSYDNDGQVVSYSWDFGDGNTSNSETVKHQYTQAGTYTYKLSVTDNQGAQGQTTGQVTIQNGNSNRWTITPASGNVAPNSSQSINVSFDASNLAVGTYQAELNINSNGGNTVIPITINVSDTTTSVQQNLGLPKNFGISQNYPNPFNPSTTINYTLPKESFVKVRVYDSIGRIVAALVDKEQPAGYYSINFNADKLSSGVYFYNINAGNFNVTKKMLLLK